MSGFGVLHYTDCVPGQGLQGTAGFQFQAASPGPAKEGMGPVRRSALYEAPTGWMRDRRPVEDYPLSLAHVVEGDLFATAAGRYLGKEANGNREGNQFTHAVVTRDPRAYGPVRPAQLWAAPWWGRGPTGSTELAPMPGPPEAGPLDIDTVHERLREAPGGPGLLTALVSALHHLGDTERRRPVVLVTADPERAACWLAGATLLLPADAAVRIGFKVFVTDPHRGGHDVLALHPEWAGRWADTGPGTGLAVFDLERGTHSEVEPTDEATFWVPRFLDGDPYDVVDAVELTGRFTGGSARCTAVDRIVALTVVDGAPLDRPGDTEQAVAWLAAARPEAVVVARDAVLDAVLDADPSVAMLADLAATAVDRGWEDRVPALRGRLLDAELAEIAGGPNGPAALARLRARPALRGGTGPAEGTARVRTALWAAAPDQVPALCALAARHGLGPEPGWSSPAALDRFARWWVERPEPELRPDRWPVPPEALDQVAAVLRAMLAGTVDDRRRAVAAIRARWLDVFWDSTADLSDPLSRALAAQAASTRSGPERTDVLRAVLRAATAAGERDPGDTAWTTILPEETCDPAAVLWFLRNLERQQVPLSAVVAARAGAVIDLTADISTATVDVVERIRSAGYPLSRHSAAIERSRTDLDEVEKRLRGRASRRTAKELAASIAAAPPEILSRHAGPLARAMAAGPSERAVGVLRIVPAEARRALMKALENDFSDATPLADHSARAMSLVYLLAGAPDMSKEQRNDFRILRERLGAVVAGVDDAGLARIERCHDLGDGWFTWARRQRSGVVKNLLGRFRAGRASGKD